MEIGDSANIVHRIVTYVIGSLPAASLCHPVLSWYSTGQSHHHLKLEPCTTMMNSIKHRFILGNVPHVKYMICGILLPITCHIVIYILICLSREDFLILSYTLLVL